MGALARIAAIVHLHLAQLLHDRGELFSAIALPLLLTTLLGFMYGGSGGEPKVAVALVDEDGSIVSRLVRDTLAATPSFKVTRAKRSDAEAGVAEDAYTAAVIVPKGFGEAVSRGESASLEMLEVADASRALAVRQVVQGVGTRLSADQLAVRVTLRQLRLARKAFEARLSLGRPHPPQRFPTGHPGQERLAKRNAIALAAARTRSLSATALPYLEEDPERDALFETADGYWTPAPVKVESKTLTASAVRGESTDPIGHEQSSLGVTVWFVLMLLLGSAVTLLEERENRTLPRLLTTPTPRAVVLLGKVVGIFFVGILQAALLIVFGALVFKVPWGNDPLATALVVACYTLAATGMAVALASVARTRSQASAFGPVLSVGLAMLGGTMWPLAVVPPFMQTVAKFTPTGQAMTALTEIVVRNRGIEAALTPSLALLAMAAAFFAVGVSRFKYE